MVTEQDAGSEPSLTALAGIHRMVHETAAKVAVIDTRTKGLEVLAKSTNGRVKQLELDRARQEGAAVAVSGFMRLALWAMGIVSTLATVTGVVMAFVV